MRAAAGRQWCHHRRIRNTLQPEAVELSSGRKKGNVPCERLQFICANCGRGGNLRGGKHFAKLTTCQVKKYSKTATSSDEGVNIRECAMGGASLPLKMTPGTSTAKTAGGSGWDLHSRLPARGEQFGGLRRIG